MKTNMDIALVLHHAQVLSYILPPGVGEVDVHLSIIGFSQLHVNWDKERSPIIQENWIKLVLIKFGMYHSQWNKWAAIFGQGVLGKIQQGQMQAESHSMKTYLHHYNIDTIDFDLNSFQVASCKCIDIYWAVTELLLQSFLWHRCPVGVRQINWPTTFTSLAQLLLELVIFPTAQQCSVKCAVVKLLRFAAQFCWKVTISSSLCLIRTDYTQPCVGVCLNQLHLLPTGVASWSRFWTMMHRKEGEKTIDNKLLQIIIYSDLCKHFRTLVPS